MSLFEEQLAKQAREKEEPRRRKSREPRRRSITGRPSMARLDWRSVYGIEKIR